MKKLLNIGIDVDDVLYECNQYAIDLANEEYGFNPPIVLSDIKSWGLIGSKVDTRLKYYNEATFFENQPVMDGAKEFIHELSKIANIFITSAIQPEFMSIRALRILKDFPEIKSENIILGNRKDIYNLQFTLDDGGHNILNSNAEYPILFRRPWNSDLTGLLSVNNYHEALNMVKQIVNSQSTYEDIDGNIFCLVGPSGSGKTSIMQELVSKYNFNKIKSTTSRKPRVNEIEDYNFTTKDEFSVLKANDGFIETSVYAGEYYGTQKEDINNAILSNKKYVIATDICGAMALKRFSNKVILVFINRNKKEAIESILQRNISIEDKANRIVSLNDEYKNKDLCDYCLENDSNIEDVVKKFILMINQK